MKEAYLVANVIYGVLVFVNIAGNSLVCLVVRRFPFMRTPMNFLIVHLALCDILSGVFALPRRVFSSFYEHPSGPIGVFFCKCITLGSIGWVPSVAGIYTLIAIAWERYIAITKPLAPRFSNKKVKLAIVISWLFGILFWFPTGLYATYNTDTKSCEVRWGAAWGVLADSLFWLILVCAVPSAIIGSLYGRVIRMLWLSKNRVEDVSQRSLIRSRKRVTKSVIIVTVILFVCWTPNILYYALTSIWSQTSTWKQDEFLNVSPIFYRISYGLVLFNFAINPFIYAIQDIRFRRCIKNLFCRRGSETIPQQGVTVQ